MKTAELLTAIDEVRHDVDAWDYNITTRVYTVRTGPFTCTVKPIGLGWWWEVKHKDAGTLTTTNADTAAEGRRLALDYCELYVQANVHA